MSTKQLLLWKPYKTAKGARVIAVFPIRPGDDNPELRYAIRSLENVDTIDAIVTVGHLPDWLHPDDHIDGNQHDTSQANVYNNIRAACRHLDTEAQVAIWNDDIYATAPTTIPVCYRSTLDEHLALPRMRKAAGQWWPTSLETTKLCLQAHGIAEPLSYELHIPFLCDPRVMADILDLFAHVTPSNPPQWRSLYGNLRMTDPVRMVDGKAYGPGQINEPWHSTEDRSYPHFEQGLAHMFPAPSRWER